MSSKLYKLMCREPKLDTWNRNEDYASITMTDGTALTYQSKRDGDFLSRRAEELKIIIYPRMIGFNDGDTGNVTLKSENIINSYTESAKARHCDGFTMLSVESGKFLDYIIDHFDAWGSTEIEIEGHKKISIPNDGFPIALAEIKIKKLKDRIKNFKSQNQN
ncbi:hypothetical protein GCM10009104_25700 [Marinobacterium maritimum]|uniref:Uncharacterized protein n=1 Tax=Marinobacterium maritimum TaxID=500162 RepID=A0ABP3TEW4_9GAMM